MMACCYAACVREASDNVGRGPQRGRGGGRGILLVIEVTQVHCSRVEGGREKERQRGEGGHAINDFVMVTRCEKSNKSPGRWSKRTPCADGSDIQ